MSFLPDPFYELVLQRPFYLVLPLIAFILWGWLSYKTLYAPAIEATSFENDTDSARKRWISLLTKESFKAFYLSLIYWLINITSRFNLKDDLATIGKGKTPTIFTSESLSAFLVITSLFQVSMFFIGYIFFDIGSYFGTVILDPLSFAMKFGIVFFICNYFHKNYLHNKHPEIDFIYDNSKITKFLEYGILIFIVISVSTYGRDHGVINMIFILMFFNVTLDYISQLHSGAHPESLLLLLLYPLITVVVFLIFEYTLIFSESGYLMATVLFTSGMGALWLFHRYFPPIFDKIRRKYFYTKLLGFTTSYIVFIILISLSVIYLYKDKGYNDIYFSLIVYTIAPISLAFFGWISFCLTRFFLIKIYISKQLKKSIFFLGLVDFFFMLFILFVSLFFITKTISFVNHIVCYDVIDLHAITEGMKVDSYDSDYLLLFIMIIPVFLPTLVHIFLVSASLILWLPEHFRLWMCKEFYVDRHAKLMMFLYITVAPVLAILGPVLLSYLLISSFSLDYFENLIENLSFTPHYPAY